MRLTCIVVLLLAVSACTQHPKADKIVLGKVWTGNPEQQWAEGMAIIGDSIVEVGSAADIEKWIGPETEKITTVEGNLIVPGFIDCHVHFVEGGFALSSVQLRDAKTPEEFISRIAAYAHTVPKGTWITSGDWDHENWGGKLPTREWIDSVTLEHPVWINRLDGHMSLANTAALKLAGITNAVKDVDGGTIVRDKKRNVTGIFKDNAMSLIDKVVPRPSDEQEDKALEAAMAYVAARGVTSVHNMSFFEDTFERAHDRGSLKTRIYSGMTLGRWRELAEKIKTLGKGDKWLRRGNLKEFVDGSLGSHTAAFFKPFDDTPRDSGFFVIEPALLKRNIKSADSAGLQLMVHAIGDKAIHTLLNIFEEVIKENGERDRRFRIEHAQHIAPADFKRFAELDVIPSVQPYHAIDDGRWAEKFIGHERSTRTYAFKSLLDANAKLAFGSDWFVAPPTPLEGIYAAVTRRTLDDKNPEGWIPEQKITVEEALRAYTANAAYASFEEGVKGSLEQGKLADFVVLEKDITSIPATEIRNVSVLMTCVGGKTVFKK
ncbi:MAG TPA: amidohydrolase [Chryseolinea sp.]|nr:amidohydrolase [Chryseolinea sp.]